MAYIRYLMDVNSKYTSYSNLDFEKYFVSQINEEINEEIKPQEDISINFEINLKKDLTFC